MAQYSPTYTTVYKFMATRGTGA